MVAYDEFGIDTDGQSRIKALGVKERGYKGVWYFVLCCCVVCD